MALVAAALPFGSLAEAGCAILAAAVAAKAGSVIVPTESPSVSALPLPLVTAIWRFDWRPVWPGDRMCLG